MKSRPTTLQSIGAMGLCCMLMSTSSAGSYRDAVLASGPVAYWTFAEPDASQPALNVGLLGESGIGHGTYSADADLGQPALVAGETDGSIRVAPGSAMISEEFDKFSDVDGFGGTGFSVEFWTAAEQVSGGFANLVGDGTGGLNFNLMVYSGAGGFIRPHVQTNENGFASIDSTRRLEAGEIVHVVSTWDADSGDFNLYLDGELADTITSAGFVPIDGTPAYEFNPIFVGQDGREPSPLAWIDEVAIYNYALDESNIASHYALGEGAASPLPEPPKPFEDPGNIPGLPAGLVSYIDFDESAAPGDGGILDFAYDRQGENNGSFQGNATRVPGLVGTGAARFDNSGGTQVALGPGVDNSFSVVEGITVEALIQPEWSGDSLDYDEIFRKEDGGNRILLSFQNDPNNGGAEVPVDEGPVLSFGLNVAGAYGELDMPLDVDLAELDGGNVNSGTVWLEAPGGGLGPNDVVLRDGETHHVAATYDAESGEKQIWIDGVLRWSVDLAGEITSGGGAVAYLGAVNGGENWTGVIDEFAFWSRALDSAEIELHYGNVLSGSNYFGLRGVPGDFDGDGVLTTADIDLLTEASASNSTDLRFDLNGDAAVNQADVVLWIEGEDYAFSWVGDADVNGEFNSSDLVTMLSAGTYEVNKAAVWSTGDFNGDGLSNSSDLVAALSGGGYEQGPRAAVAAVPEPDTAIGLFLGGLIALHRKRRSAGPAIA